MAAKVYAIRIDIVLVAKEIGGSQDIVDLAEKSLFDSRVVVSAA